MENEERPDEENCVQQRFVIDVADGGSLKKSVALMILNRMSYVSQQIFDEATPSPDKTKQYINRIVEYDSQQSDYLLPDTPLKEATFRVLLAAGNKPMSAEEISEVLSEKWSMTAYPRDVSPRVIQRLLEHSDQYCIVKT